MKKMLMLVLAMSLALFGAYQPGDQIQNYTWQDSDGGDPVTRTMDEVINSGKIVVITWGYKG